MLLGEVKPELHQSMVEVGTKVCHTPAEVRAELVRLRRLVMDLAAKNGLCIAAAGSAPLLVLDDAGDHAARALHRACARTCRTWPSGCSSSARTCTSASRTASSSSTA